MPRRWFRMGRRHTRAVRARGRRSIARSRGRAEMELLLEFDDDAHYLDDDARARRRSTSSSAVVGRWARDDDDDDDDETYVAATLRRAVRRCAPGNDGSDDDANDAFEALTRFVSDGDEDALALTVIKLLELVGGDAAVMMARGDDEDDDGNENVGENDEHGHGMDVAIARCDAGYVKLGVELARTMPETKYGPSHRGALLRGVRHVLRSYMGNCHAVCEHGVVQELLRSLDALLRSNENGKADGDVKIVAECARRAAGFSMSALDLKVWLELAAASTPESRGFLLDQLNMTLQTRFSTGPAELFLLDGESSGILGSAQPKWPFTEGLAFVTWVYLESVSASETTAASAASYAAAASASQVVDASPLAAAAVAAAAAGEDEVHMPRLFSFLSAEGQGVECYFHDGFLILETNGVKESRMTLPFSHKFPLKRWFCLGIEHKPASVRTGGAETRLYVNGICVETHKFDLPKISKPLGFCCIGTNPPAAMAGLQRKRRQCALFASLGPVYIFKQALGGHAMKALSARGGSYVPRFSSNDDKGGDVNVEDVLDKVLAPTILQVLHPRMASKNYVLDISPAGVSIESKAALLGGTTVARRNLMRDSIWASCESGPAIMLPFACPLVSSRNLAPEISDAHDDFASAGLSIRSVIGIIAGACENHPPNLKVMEDKNVPSLLAHALPFAMDALRRQFSGDILDDEEEAILDAIEHLLSVCKSEKVLSKQLLSTLVLDFKPWNGSGARVVRRLLNICSSLCNTSPDLMQEISALQLLFDNGRRWLSPATSLMGGILHSSSTKSVMDDRGELRVSEKELLGLIDDLLVSVNLLVNTSEHMDAKVEIIIGFLAECPCPHMLSATIKLVHSMIVSPKADRANEFLFAFVSKGGVEVCMGLMRALALRGKFDHQLQGVQGLFAECVRLFGYMLETGCVSANKTTEVGGSKKVTKGSIERAVRYAFIKGSAELLTVDVYEAIIQSSISINLASINMTEPARLISGGMLGSMLSTLPKCEESVSSRALNDVMLIACAYADNRNLLLSLPEFPEWLVEILVQSTISSALSAANDLLMILLQHSMRLPDGWRVLETVIESIKMVTKDDVKKRAEVQQLVLQSLATFMISELKGISVSDDNRTKKSRENLSANSNATFENIIALLDMIEDHLRLLSAESLSPIHSYDIGKISNALVCYGAYATDSANGWVNRCRLIEGLVATPSAGSTAMGGQSLELLRLTQQMINFMVGMQCTGADSYSLLLKDDELVLLFLRLTLAYFREEDLPIDDDSYDSALPLMPAHIVNTLPSLTSGSSSISDAIVFEAKHLWGTTQSSEAGKKLAVLHNLLVPLLQAASVRKTARLAPGAIALLLDEVWRYSKLKGRKVVYIKAITTYLIALVARWREVIVAGEKDDISPKLRSLASGSLSSAIISLCSAEWTKILMSSTIKETLICVVKSTPMGETRNSVVAARGPDATESRLSAQRAVHHTRTDTFKKFVTTWEGEYVHISMSSKWLAALSKEASRRTLSIAAEGEKKSEVIVAWEGYMRALQASNSLVTKIKDDGDVARLGIDPSESGRRRRYSLSRMAMRQRLTHLAPVDSKAMEIKLPVRQQHDASDDEDDLPLSPQRSMNNEELNEVMAATAALAVAANRSEVKKSNYECSATMVTPLDIYSGKFTISDKEMIFYTEDNSHVWSWPLEHLHQVQSRRYLLRRSALEFFMLDRMTYFIDFGTAEQRRQVFRVLIKLKPKNFVPLYLETSKPEALLRKSDITSRWIRREISNFDYIMALNTLAGRSYQDITQYPVFPWVLTDYTSETLDLSNPDVYRDLRKPIGALNPDRLARIKERYDFFDDPEIPKFHYGSHYSSSGTVLFYLLRVDPFTTLAYELQGGKFDHADRLFHDIASTWKSCYNDMSDVKELVPEFFYLPEMFKNVNNIDFGVTQSGEKVDAVILPPWAKSPEDFVAKQREALESDYVSKNLHHWVDLIFGYKQRGKAAESACNVFYYMTYEGAVDVEAIQDPILLKATQDQIACFGQTPSQLLTIPHPGRQRAADSVIGCHWLFDNGDKVNDYLLNTPSYADNRVAFMDILSTGQLVVISTALEMKTHRFMPSVPSGAGLPFTFEPAKEQSTLGSFMGSIRRRAGFTDVTEAVKFNAKLDPKLIKPGRKLPCAMLPGGRHVVIGGHADNSLKVFNCENGSIESNETGHRAPVISISISADGRVLATGSVDGTIGIWLIRIPTEKVTLGENLRETIAPIIRVDVNSIFNEGSTVANVIDRLTTDDAPTTKMTLNGPISLLKGHGESITSLAINTNLDLILAVTPAAGASLYSVMKGAAMVTFPNLRGSLCAISDEAFLVVWNELQRTLTVVSLNGNIISTISLVDTCSTLTTLLVSKDGYHLVAGTASSEGKVAVVAFDLPSLRLRHRWEFESNSDISQVVMTADNTNILVSTHEGAVRVLVDPSLAARVLESALQAGWSSVV